MNVYLLTSTDREHGGRVIHGVFSTYEKAHEASKDIEDIDYWRIPMIYELELDKFHKETP